MKKEALVKLFPIETDRLKLRLITQGDAHLIQSAKESRAADVLRRWMSWSSDEAMSMQGTLDYLDIATAPDNTRCIGVIAVDKATGGHVLSTGLDAADDDFKSISTGWWLSAGHEGKGLAYEGMQALIQFCRDQKIGQKITADYYEGNERSRKLLERLGFQHVGTKAKNHRCHLNGEMMDEHNYELELPMADKISIRQWTVDDWQMFKAMRLEALSNHANFFGFSYEVAAAKEDSFWQEILGDVQKSAVFALYDKGVAIGFTGIYRHTERNGVAVLIMSYIREEYRKQGLSEKLYQARIDWAKAQGDIHTVTVGHREGNDASRAANQRLGFKFVRIDEGQEYGDGTKDRDYVYELQI